MDDSEKRRELLEKVDQKSVRGMRARRGLADRPVIRVDEMKGVLIGENKRKRRVGRLFGDNAKARVAAADACPPSLAKAERVDGVFGAQCAKVCVETQKLFVVGEEIHDGGCPAEKDLVCEIGEV